MPRKKVVRNRRARSSRRAAPQKRRRPRKASPAPIVDAPATAQEKRRRVAVIRTAEDFHAAVRPVPRAPRIPVPYGLARAAYEAVGSEQPITVTCARYSWNVSVEEARTFADWLDAEQTVRNFDALRRTRRRGRPALDWYGLLSRLVPAIEGGEPLDAALDRLRKRYGIQTLHEAHRWIKVQRQVSTARLLELDRRRITGSVPDYERTFHETIVRLLPPRRPGRRPALNSGE